MDCNAISPDITSLILMAMLQNPALSQKVLKDWFRLPERQELFPGLFVLPSMIDTKDSSFLQFFQLDYHAKR